MDKLLDEACGYWNAGRLLEAGRLLCERIPMELRPAWAAEALAVACSRLPAIPEVKAVLEIAQYRSRWPEAREALSAVKALTLQAEEQAEEPLYVGILVLAENVAKVTYNAGVNPAAFDPDWGYDPCWWIAGHMKRIVDQVNDPQFTSQVWAVLSDARFVQSVENLLDEARGHWNAGRSLEAGRLLFERIPMELRPAWAASVLDIALSYLPTIPEVEAVLQIAEDPSRWPEAYEAFSAVRALTLQAEGQAGGQLYPQVLGLAELVAKVTYNASEDIAPFDPDSGWWIAVVLKNIVDEADDPEFAVKAWAVLSSERFLCF
jgi:hypothetical protein